MISRSQLRNAHLRSRVTDVVSAELPIELATIKSQLRIPPADGSKDGDLRRMLQAATQQLESDISGYVRPATVTEVFDQVPAVGVPFSLARFPIVSVDKVNVRDVDGNWVEVDAAEYNFDAAGPPARLLLKTLPSSASLDQQQLQLFAVEYTAQFQPVPPILLDVLHRAVADMFLNVGKFEDSALWQYAIRSYAWGPLV